MKVYAYPADQYGCGYYRIIWPALALADREDVEVKIVLPGEDTGLATVMRGNTVQEVIVPPDADVIVLQRPGFPILAQAVPYIRSKGIAVVVDVDDDLSHIDPRNPAWLAMHPNQEYKTEQYARMYEAKGEPDKAMQIRSGRAQVSPHSWQAVMDACRYATLVTVSTPALRSVYGFGHATVLPNYVPADFLRAPRVDSTMIGWAGSTHSHPGDLSAMGHSIRQLTDNGASFMIVGNGDNADDELGLREPVPSSGVIDFQQWISAVSQIGIGVAPLEDSRFNQAKSWLKPLEYAAAGVPWVASPRREYESFHQLYPEAGALAEKPRDWIRQLKRLIDDDSYREFRSEAARALARQMTIEEHAWKWAEAWTVAFDRQRGKASASAAS